MPVSRRRVGRPLSFDREVALEQAMLAFWRHGYETTSIVDLTTAMGVSAPSLYAAFGDKKRLFLEAMRRYAGDTDAIRRRVDGAATAREAARDMLVGAAVAYTGADTPRGCLLASATASGSAGSADVQQAVAGVRRLIEAGLRARVERDVAEGVLPPGTDAAALSGLVMALAQGLSTLARDGAGRASLLAVVEAGLGGWPKEARSGSARTRKGSEDPLIP
ncbi:MAG: TetR/AcrR family transcriptional regulator [Janthinobacterium lividum]